MENITISIIDSNCIKLALKIHKQYSYNYYDCLIIAAALNSNCEFLITEDMADGQIVENKLTIVNIFSENNVKKYLE